MVNHNNTKWTRWRQYKIKKNKKDEEMKSAETGRRFQLDENTVYNVNIRYRCDAD